MSLHSIGYLFREGLKSLWKNRTMSIASIGVLIACLLMTGVAALLTLNISATMQSVEGNNVITVYLSSDVPALTAVRIGEEIRQIDNIAECTFVPKDTALSGVMQDIDGGGTLFDSFTGDNNPLPDSYEISLADLSIYDETVSQITAIEGVESVSNYDAYASLVKVVINQAPFLTIVNIHPYVFALYGVYIITGMLFGLLGGTISIGKYLKKQGENAIV